MKRGLKRAYFTGASLLMQSMEQLQAALPGLSRVARFPALISPLAPNSPGIPRRDI